MTIPAKFTKLCSIATLAVAFASDPHGLHPRAKATDYPAFAAQDGLQVAAEALDQEQVKKYFATDLSNGYAVVEVAVYPGATGITLNDLDFSLRVNGSNSTIRPTSPEAIAASLTRPKHRQPDVPTRLPGDIAIYPTGTIGVESGGYDPVTGRRGTGVYGGGGVGVGIGGPSGPAYPAPDPRSDDRNRSTMERELSDKQLPQGSVNGPVAGYLYFPLPSGHRKVVITALEYTGETGTVKVVFPSKKH